MLVITFIIEILHIDCDCVFVHVTYFHVHVQVYTCTCNCMCMYRYIHVTACACTDKYTTCCSSQYPMNSCLETTDIRNHRDYILRNSSLRTYMYVSICILLVHVHACSILHVHVHACIILHVHFLGKVSLGCAMLLCLVCLFAFACFFLSSFSHLSKTCTCTFWLV